MAGEGQPPKTILLVGAGVFSLSTALSLLSSPRYASSQFTILEASPVLPNPHGSSVDASRIVRADYASLPYARLAAQGQELWRDTSDAGWGGQGRYHEPGFLITTDAEKAVYVRRAMENVQSLEAQGLTGGRGISELKGEEEIRKASGYDGVSGVSGYANWNSGWADATKSVEYALDKVRREGAGRVTIRAGAVVDRLDFREDGTQCKGVVLQAGETVAADLTILATGAWTPSLIDLQGRCLATGQSLTYIDITDEEQRAMEHRPTIINMSQGMFIIPPRGNELKVARHGYGYRNPVKIAKQKITPGSQVEGEVEVSVPRVDVQVPHEGKEASREAMRTLVPHMADRAFKNTRICWYCDTPTGDFLIAHHPTVKQLFIATGGSGHGFKFFPVIGDKIVAAIEGKLEDEYAQLWRWRSDREIDQGFTCCDDGSRAGRMGMVLEEELKRGPE